MAEDALEGEGDQEEEQAAEKARIEDRLECIGLRVLQFACIADGRLEAVGGPGRDIETSEKERPAAVAPGTVGSRVGSRRRQQIGDVGHVDLAAEDREQADNKKRHEDYD